MNPIERRKNKREPRWRQTEEKMLLILDFATDIEDEWNASNWAIWKIMKLKQEIQDCEILIDRYEPVQDDLAMWFDNCGMEELSGKQVAQIIRKWRPE